MRESVCLLAHWLKVFECLFVAVCECFTFCCALLYIMLFAFH